ncbi:unnamed protein product [Cylindrotheca closterium]|uniref:SET domain-containing protein n=1 Tax=Cylindrotheca closterium TaxID=2856 RepID=A0AAD2FR84_9STRA|nr:unnamed protein product [Cylindrotheca closterium]
MRTDFAPFLAWSQAKGIITPLELVSSGSYRKMVLPSDESKLLSQSKSEGLVQLIQAPLDACMVGEDFETLVDKLIFEKKQGSDSDYAPWLDQFPTVEDFSGMPRFWTQERRDWVKQFDGGQLETRMDRDKLRFDKVDDQWALACVDSRSNFLPDNTYSMTPVLDMLNHDARVKTSARVDGADRLLLEATSDTIYLTGQDGKEEDSGNDWKSQLFGGFFAGGNNEGSTPSFRAGEEVFVSYGNFDNLETLCNYGFVAEDNVANIESFRVRVMGKAPAYLVIEKDGSIDNLFNMISLTDLRVNLLVESEIELLKEYNGDGIISERNELETWAVISGELDEAAYEAKTGIQEAEAKNDTMVASYLRGRYNTLQKGLDKLKVDYPDLF